MNEQEHLSMQSNDKLARRDYTPPTLTVFGKIALLTQSGASPCTSDGSTCNAGSGMGMASARALKENIVRLATHPLGIRLYLYDYKSEFRDRWGHGKQFGVMADEVETVLPEAVCVHPDGYKVVDYAMLARASRCVH